MRNIEFIAVHCTATQPDAKVESIQNYWKTFLKWKSPGYHVMVKADGTCVDLLPISEVSNGVGGWNSKIINISYIGGIDKNGQPKDTRTDAQKVAILCKLKEWKRMFPKAKIQGHKDFPNVHKACPSFDAKTEYKDLR